jgi:hypothetical protein
MLIQFLKECLMPGIGLFAVVSLVAIFAGWLFHVINSIARAADALERIADALESDDDSEDENDD